MKIEVTQEDIDRGRRVNPCHCPVALALVRATNSLLGDVDVVEVFAYLNRFDARFELPGIAQQFVRDFDKQRPVQPFTFDLPIQL